MNTFDTMAPTFDLPASVDNVRGWLLDAAYTDFEARLSSNGVDGNGVKPLPSDSIDQ
jgi:hypothetical protein